MNIFYEIFTDQLVTSCGMVQFSEDLPAETALLRNYL